jgi:hypothetical protein
MRGKTHNTHAFLAAYIDDDVDISRVGVVPVQEKNDTIGWSGLHNRHKMFEPHCEYFLLNPPERDTRSDDSW